MLFPLNFTKKGPFASNKGKLLLQKRRKTHNSIIKSEMIKWSTD